jgi:hypothetical protein
MSSFEGTKLRGIVYIHSIEERKALDSTMRDIKEFRGICGDDPKRSFVVATTMWQGVPPDVGSRRETELKTEESFLKFFHDAGVEFVRHPGSQDEHASAQEIIRCLLKEPQALCPAKATGHTRNGPVSQSNGSKQRTGKATVQILVKLFSLTK